jgi:hypothetical protein
VPGWNIAWDGLCNCVEGGAIKRRTEATQAVPVDRKDQNVGAPRWLVSNYDTTAMKAIHADEPDGEALYVLSSTGVLYSAAATGSHSLHHTTFQAGLPVAAAGMMRVENGKLVSISNASGHYQPKPQYLKNILVFFKQKGLNLQGVLVKEDEWSECDVKHTKPERKKLHKVGWQYEEWATSHGLAP